MQPDLIYVALLVSMATGTLNLFMTLRLVDRTSAKAPPPPEPEGLMVDAPVPAFGGRKLADGQRIASEDLVGEPQVLLFLSANCPKCHEATATLGPLLPAMAAVGVGLQIVGVGPADDFARLAGDGPLAPHLLTMDAASRRLINPRDATPMYVFVDHGLVVKATGFVGDEDWLSFVEQLLEAGHTSSSTN